LDLTGTFFEEIINSIPLLEEVANHWFDLFNYFSQYCQMKRGENLDKIGSSVICIAVRLVGMNNIFQSAFKPLGIEKLEFVFDSINLVKEKLYLLYIEDPNLKNLLSNIGIDTSKLSEGFFKMPKKPPFEDEFKNENFENSPINIAIRRKNTSLSDVTSEFDEILNNEHWFENVDPHFSMSYTEPIYGETVSLSNVIMQKNSLKKSQNNLTKQSENLAKNFINKNNQMFPHSNQQPISSNSEKLNGKSLSTMEFKIEATALPPSFLQEQLQKHTDISQLYKDVKNLRHQNEIIDLDKPLDSSATSNEKPERWTYGLLAQSNSMTKLVSTILNSFMDTYYEYNEKNSSIEQIEWCIMIDNSGSMAPKVNSIFETLVVIIEILRRLECKFAIARFGNPKDKKALLKEIDVPMSFSLGQKIFESFTFDQGTRPASCLKNICKTVWPKSNKNSKRIVLMITDGLTVETDPDYWKSTISSYDLHLGVVLMKHPKHYYPEALFKQITDNGDSFNIINANESDSVLAINSFDLIEKLFKNNIGKSDEQYLYKNILIEVPTTKKHDIINLEKIIRQVNFEKALENGHYRPSTMYKICRNNIQVMNDQEDKGLANFMKNESKSEEFREKLEKYYSDMENSIDYNELLEETLKTWSVFEKKMCKEIDSFQEVLEEYVFPNNKFTRKRGDIKGSALYLPGLIKAVASDFTYTKIFSSKTAGGCKSYNIILGLDVSYSMNGHLIECAIESLISLICALVRIGIENFALLLFGKTVKLVKLQNQSWNRAAIYALLTSLDCDVITTIRDQIMTLKAIICGSIHRFLLKVY
jgi:hypothetical protein